MSFVSTLGSRARTVVTVGVVILTAIAAWSVLDRAHKDTATAYFTETKGLYVGDHVKVLGVRVGEVTAIVPEPDRVRVEFQYDVDLPADVKAVITAPSLVPVRELNLTPVYDGGPKLDGQAEIPMSRTAVPVEWDQIKSEVNELALALGPQGANADGALSRAVDTAALNLEGQGGSLRQTLGALSEAMSTLADNRGEVFGTVRNLLVFVNALRSADAQVVEFNGRLASVAEILGDNSDEVSKAVAGLNRAFADVTTFLEDHRGALARSVKEMRPVARVLAENRQNLADVLHTAPTALSNLYGIYDPIDGSLAANLAAVNLQAPAVFVCTALLNLGGTRDDCYTTLGPLAQALALDPPGIGIGAVERNGRSNKVYARPGPEPSADDPAADLTGLMMGGVQ